MHASHSTLKGKEKQSGHAEKRKSNTPDERLVFTPDSPELNRSKNQLIVDLREIRWLVLMAPKENALFREVDGQLIIAGKKLTNHPGFLQMSGQQFIVQNTYLRNLLLDELFALSEDSEENNIETIKKIMSFWNQSLLSTAAVLFMACISNLVQSKKLEFGSVPEVIYTTNLLRDKNGTIYVETVTSSIVIKHGFSPEIVIPGTCVVRFELTSAGFRFTHITLSNPFLKKMLIDEVVDFSDNNLIHEAVEYELAAIHQCEDEHLSGWAKEIVDIIQPMLEESVENPYDLATLYGTLSLLKMITQNPYNQTLFINLQRIFNRPLQHADFPLLKIHVDNLIQTYQPTLSQDMSHSLYFKKLNIEIPEDTPPIEIKPPPVSWTTLTSIAAGSSLALLATGVLLMLLISSGTATPFFIAVGAIVLTIAKSVGISLTVPPVTAGGLAIFTAAAPFAIAIGGECGYLLKKAVTGFFNLFKRKQPPITDIIKFDSSLLDEPELDFKTKLSRDLEKGPRYPTSSHLHSARGKSNHKKQTIPSTKQKTSPTCLSKLFCCFYCSPAKKEKPAGNIDVTYQQPRKKSRMI